jgi:hypothetical protein
MKGVKVHPEHPTWVRPFGNFFPVSYAGKRFILKKDESRGRDLYLEGYVYELDHSQRAWCPKNNTRVALNCGWFEEVGAVLLKAEDFL